MSEQYRKPSGRRPRSKGSGLLAKTTPERMAEINELSKQDRGISNLSMDMFPEWYQNALQDHVNDNEGDDEQ